MEYKEEVFEKSVNRKTTIVWLVSCIAFTAAYAIGAVNGQYTPGYFAAFAFFCWLPYGKGRGGR